MVPKMALSKIFKSSFNNDLLFSLELGKLFFELRCPKNFKRTHYYQSVRYNALSVKRKYRYFFIKATRRSLKLELLID